MKDHESEYWELPIAQNNRGIAQGYINGGRKREKKDGHGVFGASVARQFLYLHSQNNK